MRRALAELAGWLDVAVPAVSPEVLGVAIDSRTVRPGDLFAALPGARTDGHDHVAEAAARGAVAALVSRPLAHTLPQLVVPDTTVALQALAAAERRHSDYRLVGITGSIGKTTTRGFLVALLQSRYRVGFTRGSRNSQAGLPAELLSQADGIQWMVAELGMNHAGELDRLGAIARPDALLYTVIAPVHLEFFPNLEAIAEAKAELIRHLDRDGVLVLNAADPRVDTLAGRFGGRVVRYGRPGASDLWIERYASRGLLGATIVLRGESGQAEVSWDLIGRHQADNLLGAACCATSLGLPLDAVPQAAAGLRPAAHRGELIRLPGGVTVVDDSYNSSPVAVRRLLSMLTETAGRRVAVLGEMYELGEATTAAHREAGRLAAGACDLLIAVGGQPARELAEAARAAGLGDARLAAGAEDAATLLAETLEPGDVVLIKGSRGVGLDRTVAALTSGRAG